jgi:subtilisin family serine protease
MLSKAVGRRFGISKEADVTIVKVPFGKYNPNSMMDLMGDQTAIESTFRMKTLQRALEEVFHDVMQRGLQRRSVVNLSWQIPTSSTIHQGMGPDSWETRLQRVIEVLINNDVVVVCASGNDGIPDPVEPGQVPNVPEWHITGVPPVWNGNMPLIVVGGVYSDGKFWEGTQYLPSASWPNTHVDVWAPAYQVTLGIQGLGQDQFDGTSACKILHHFQVEFR